MQYSSTTGTLYLSESHVAGRPLGPVLVQGLQKPIEVAVWVSFTAAAALRVVKEWPEIFNCTGLKTGTGTAVS